MEKKKVGGSKIHIMLVKTVVHGRSGSAAMALNTVWIGDHMDFA